MPSAPSTSSIINNVAVTTVTAAPYVTSSSPSTTQPPDEADLQEALRQMIADLATRLRQAFGEEAGNRYHAALEKENLFSSLSTIHRIASLDDRRDYDCLGIRLGDRPALAALLRSWDLDVRQLDSPLNGWELELAKHFEEPHLTRYILAMKRECLDVKQLSRLNVESLNLLGVRMGHRQKLLRVAESFASRRSHLMRHHGGGGSGGGFSSGAGRLAHIAVANENGNASSRVSAFASQVGLRVTVTKNINGVEWVDCCGFCNSYEEFIAEAFDFVSLYGFPNAFRRFFLNTKPMPFMEHVGHGNTIGCLMRIPDLTGVEGSSMTIITNRFVILFSVSDSFVLTYHRNELSQLQHAVAEWHRDDQVEAHDLGSLLELIIKEALRSYDAAISVLRDHLEAVSFTEGDEQAVIKLTAIQEKANVFRRCAKGSNSVLHEVASLDSCDPYEDHLRAVGERLETLESMCEELHSTSLSSVDLCIALSEFRSSRNLKIFTYITIVTQPISVATSWYGMNWSSMHELWYKYGYQVFAPLIWTFAIGLLMLVMYRERKLLNEFRQKRSNTVPIRDIFSPLLPPMANGGGGGVPGASGVAAAAAGGSGQDIAAIGLLPLTRKESNLQALVESPRRVASEQELRVRY